MPEHIPVERKRGSPWWIWILVLALIALLVWFVMARRNRTEGPPQRSELQNSLHTIQQTELSYIHYKGVMRSHGKNSTFTNQ
jgi:hypothetical protein